MSYYSHPLLVTLRQNSSFPVLHEKKVLRNILETRHLLQVTQLRTVEINKESNLINLSEIFRIDSNKT